jgi:hypothetical protein
MFRDRMKNEPTAKNLACICLPNDLPFSSERPGRLRAYHGHEEPRAQPAASRHEPARAGKRVAFVCCNGRLGFDQIDSVPDQHLPEGVFGEEETEPAVFLLASHLMLCDQRSFTRSVELGLQANSAMG